MSTTYRAVCTTCGSAGASLRTTPGSMGMELILWLFFIFPGIIYSIWRISARKETCAGCGRDTIISAASPNGMALLEPRGGWTSDYESAFLAVADYQKMSSRIGWLSVGLFLVFCVAMAGSAHGVAGFALLASVASLLAYAFRS